MGTPSQFHQPSSYGNNTSIFKQISSSMAFKLFIVFILVLILLIPLSWVSGLITERKQREVRVANEISSKWGSKQVISGPVVAIPFDYQIEHVVKDGKGDVVKTLENQREWIFSLPEQLDAKGTVNPEYLKRGIYKAVVYNTNLNIDGLFKPIDVQKINVYGGEIKWGEAKVVFGISDFKGLLTYPKLQWGDQELELNNEDKSFGLFEANLVADLKLTGAEDLQQSFVIAMDLRGSKSLNFLPLANQTNIEVQGSWPNPSFNGAFLPENREVTDTDFMANWSVPNFSRKLPQQWQGSPTKRLYNYHGINLIDEDIDYDYAVASAEPVDGSDMMIERSNDADMIQVNFLPEVNEYQKITRVAKYGILVILLTFVSLILVEVIKKQRIHFIQYILIGIAMVLFYSLLLAISEHLGFNKAYILAALATIMLVGSFIQLLTKKRGLALAFAGILGLFYGFIFFIMQLQDYSLIVGSIGVFVILAILMRYSAKINWYNLGSNES